MSIKINEKNKNISEGEKRKVFNLNIFHYYLVI